jgi:hypothetical protein
MAFDQGPHVMKREELPALAHLLEAYFHQDWSCDHGSPAAVLQAIIAHEPADLIGTGIEELTALLARGLSEAELKTLLYGALYVDYLPAADGLSCAEWLKEVRDTFASALAQR